MLSFINTPHLEDIVIKAIHIDKRSQEINKRQRDLIVMLKKGKEMTKGLRGFFFDNDDDNDEEKFFFCHLSCRANSPHSYDKHTDIHIPCPCP